MNFQQMAEDRAKRIEQRRADPKPIIHVVNVKHPISTWPTPHWHYVGRGMRGRKALLYPRSPLANPFKLKDCNGRDDCSGRYQRWLWQEMATHAPEVEAELSKVMRYSLTLDGISLGCWCAPQSCHADVIKAAVEWLWSEGTVPKDWTVDEIR